MYLFEILIEFQNKKKNFQCRLKKRHSEYASRAAVLIIRPRKQHDVLSP